MIYLFYGLNEYGRQRKLKTFSSAILEKKPQTAFGRFSLDEEGEVEKLYEFIVPRSLFEAAKRVAIVKNSMSAVDSEIFKRIVLLLGTDKESALVFNENWEERDIPEILVSLIKDGNIKEFYSEKLSERQVKIYLNQEMKLRNISIEPAALDYLLKVFWGDIYACVNELEKLSFLNVPITQKLLLSMDEYQKESGIFDFSRAVSFNSTLREKLLLWEKLLLQRTDSYIVFNYLAKAAGNLPLIKKIADIDISVKTGVLEPEQALLLMLLS
jgi:DNA polymerase III delta subunit